jgi:hypothetical protein
LAPPPVPGDEEHWKAFDPLEQIGTARVNKYSLLRFAERKFKEKYLLKAGLVHRATQIGDLVWMGFNLDHLLRVGKGPSPTVASGGGMDVREQNDSAGAGDSRGFTGKAPHIVDIRKKEGCKNPIA